MVAVQYRIMELARKAFRQRGEHLFAACVRSQFLHGSNWFRQPTGNDVLKVAQIGRMIQRKTVRSDPAADMHADGGHFLPIYPHAGAARNSSSWYTEVRKRVHDRLLHGPNISDH